MKIGISSPQDVLSLLIRRKWLVIGPFLALTAMLTVLASFLPKVFVSETLILIRPRDVPQQFVMDLIAGTTEQRLVAIQQTVLSRKNLVQILREFGDRLPNYRGNMDTKVAALRDDIKISFATPKKGAPASLTYFRISFENGSQELAQKVCSKISALFIEQDNKVRENQVFGTREFLDAELAKVEQELAASEDELKQMKASRPFEMPTQLETNLRGLDRLDAQKKANMEALDRQSTINLNLETQLFQTAEFIPGPIVPVANPQRPGNPGLPAPPPNPLIAEFRKAEATYKQEAAKYSEKWPSVILAKAQMENLKAQIPPEDLVIDAQGVAQVVNPVVDPVPVEPPKIPNPAYRAIAAQLESARTELRIRQEEKGWIEREIEKYTRRIENIPKNEQEMADMVRQNLDLQKQYSELKDNLSKAKLSESLESKSKGEQFEVIDEANYPLVPTKPNRKAVAAICALISLGIGLLLAVGVDIARQRIWSQSEIEALWGVPVLIDVPEILTDSDIAATRKKKYTFAASSVAAAMAYSVVLYMTYLKAPTILQKLDPLIQKVVYK